jgi:hypothetical protein
MSAITSRKVINRRQATGFCSRASGAEEKQKGVDRAIALIYILQNRVL